ncbi:MAG TPA: dolichyl-phosphate beta-glucosyltransferase [Polyangia bacterium]
MSAVIVVPCFNEAQRLPVATFATFAQSWPGRLLFVDDGSRDETARVLADLAARRPETMTAMSLPQNVGKAEAVRQGSLRALREGADVIGYWDADLATPLDEIPRFEQVLREQPGIDIVMGSRVRLLGSAVDRRPLRHYLGRGFATAVSFLLAANVYDTQCGAKLFRVTPVVREIFATPFLSRWVFDVELLARYLDAQSRAGLDGRQSMRELPLQLWRDVAGSKVRAQDFLRAGLDLARISRARRSRTRV